MDTKEVGMYQLTLRQVFQTLAVVHADSTWQYRSGKYCPDRSQDTSERYIVPHVVMIPIGYNTDPFVGPQTTPFVVQKCPAQL